LATFLVVHPYLDIYGGGEKVCHYIIKTLVNNNQNVELLTFDFNSQRYAQIMGEGFPSGVTVHSLGKRDEVKPPFTIYKRRRNMVRLLKNFRKTLKYDYLVSTQSSSPFEPVFLNKAKKNIAYVHFPEIHYDYYHSTLKRKVYLWLFKKWVEQGIKKLDIVFCNSNYTKETIERYWKPYEVKEPIVVYPPVNLNAFWCDKPLSKRAKRVTYVGRFIPKKKHELMKKLAVDFPNYEFVSIGGLVEGEKPWFDRFSQDVPKNYLLKVNLPEPDLIKTLQESKVYVHLMEGEHFGIAPIEALASGCITLAHDSGGVKEFIPQEFLWKEYDDLKTKVAKYMEADEGSIQWTKTREDSWTKIGQLNVENFQEKVWTNIKNVMQ
jgi:glycosyltransferase involved in cell wall biosynthesis